MISLNEKSKRKSIDWAAPWFKVTDIFGTQDWTFLQGLQFSTSAFDIKVSLSR